MRNAISSLFKKPYVIISVIFISATLTYFTGGPGYFFGIATALIAFWSDGFKWIGFGIGRPKWLRSILYSILYSLGIFIVIDILIQPLIELLFGVIDLSNFDGIRGNLINTLILIAFMWVVAGFGEEFLYRGFFMKRLAEIFGNTNKAWFLSAIIISSVFGLAHLYQGLSGVIATGVVGFILSIIFIKNKTNLILVMFTHGFYDVIGILLIYFNKDKIFADWIQNVLFNLF